MLDIPLKDLSTMHAMFEIHLKHLSKFRILMKPFSNVHKTQTSHKTRHNCKRYIYSSIDTSLFCKPIIWNPRETAQYYNRSIHTQSKHFSTVHVANNFPKTPLCCICDTRNSSISIISLFCACNIQTPFKTVQYSTQLYSTVKYLKLLSSIYKYVQIHNKIIPTNIILYMMCNSQFPLLHAT